MKMENSNHTEPIMETAGYEALAGVLLRAYHQAASGKGKERHANGLPFDQQPIMRIARVRGTGFLLGQADKKSEEAMGLPPGRDVAELLGAIVYLSAAVLHIEEQRGESMEFPVIHANDNALECRGTIDGKCVGHSTNPCAGSCKFHRG